MLLFALMLSLPLVYSKPHAPANLQRDIVQFEKQEIREIPADDEYTKSILDKIEELNRNRGLLNKRKQYSNVHRLNAAKQHQFQFPQFQQFMQNPFSNPILDYVHSTQHEPVERTQPKNEGDDVPGQYIKRKITHRQSLVIPSSPMINVYNNEMPLLGFAKETPPQAPKEDVNETAAHTNDIVDNQNPVPLINPYEYPLLQRQGFWQSPLTQYFPIIIRDPIQQMINAVTSMVEYGPPPSAAPAPACVTSLKSTNTIKNNDETQSRRVEIEDLELTEDKGKPIKFTVKLHGRDESPRLVKSTDSSRINNKLPGLSNLLGIKPANKSESTKADALLSLPQNKEYSQDNMGNGIFLHKLRVREGGVAIAGPGGIATAGNGGTAIVGPDGYAYTQPDSLAIAGSGSKVIAVNPGVDLGQLVKNITKDNANINSRIGRVVAVGPVVYYNKG